MVSLFDTNVLTAALEQRHPHHDRAFPWLNKAKNKDLELHLSNHTLGELYSSLTSLPVVPQPTPAQTHELVEQIFAFCTVVSMNAEGYRRALARGQNSELTGSRIFDAIIARTALEIEAEQRVTFNEKHFRGLGPDIEKLIVVPGSEGE